MPQTAGLRRPQRHDCRGQKNQTPNRLSHRGKGKKTSDERKLI